MFDEVLMTTTTHGEHLWYTRMAGVCVWEEGEGNKVVVWPDKPLLKTFTDFVATLGFF